MLAGAVQGRADGRAWKAPTRRAGVDRWGRAACARRLDAYPEFRMKPSALSLGLFCALLIAPAAQAFPTWT